MKRHQELISTVLRVRPGETERVGLMLLFSLLAVGGVVITGQLAGRSLFLSTQPPDAIPLRFILTPLALVVAVSAYSRLASRLGRLQLLRVTFVVIAAGTVVFRLLLATSLSGNLAFLLGLLVFLDLAGGLTMILFWTFAGDIFDAREARRLFGIISGGSALSNIAFGLFLGRIAARVSPADLLLVVIASLVGAALVVEYLGRRYRPPEAVRSHRAGAAPSEPRRAWFADVREVMSARLMVTLSMTVVVIALVSTIAEFQLDMALKSSFESDGQAMVSFLATFRLWAGVASAALQFLLAGYLLERFGVTTMLFLLPAAIAVGGLGILLTSGALWAVAVPRAADVSLKYTVNDSAVNLLYLPLAPHLRARAKAVVEGMVKPPLVALLGVAFLAVSRWTSLPYTAWTVPMLVLVLLWSLLLRRASRQYVQELAQSIAMRRLDPTAERVSLTDETSLTVLRNELESPDALRVIHALSLIDEAPGSGWTERVMPLLEHESTDVQIAALRHLSATGAESATAGVRRLMGSEVSQVRAEAVGTYCAIQGTRGVDEAVHLLQDPSADVRRAAVVALIRHGGLGGVLHAGQQLHALLESGEPAARRDGATLLGQLGVAGFHGPLLDLIQDPDSDVQRAAIRAAGRLALPELLPALAASLARPELRHDARDAILSCGRRDLSALARVINDPDLPRRDQADLVRGLAHHGDAAVAVLWPLIDNPDARVRAAAATGLLELRSTGSPLPADTDRMVKCLQAELANALSRWCVGRDLTPLPPHPLLDEALEWAMRADRSRILALVGLRHPDLPVRTTDEALASDDLRQRANALELIDNIVDELKEPLLAYLGGTESQRLSVAARSFGTAPGAPADRILELLADADPWLRVCALATIASAGMTEMREAVAVAQQDVDPRVRESATVTLAAISATAGHPSPAALDTVSAADRREFKEPAMPLAPVEKILFLKQVPIFREISGEEIHELLPIAQETTFATGDEIIRQGDEGDSLYIIVEGQVEIRIDGQSIGTVLSSRDVIGELAILTGDPRAASCVAVTDVLGLRIEREPFWELLRQRPEVAIGIMQILIGYVRQK